MNILFLGDIVGSAGRGVAKQWVPKLKRQYKADIVIINGENLAGGSGITPTTAQEMYDCGVDVITSGNHIWKQADVIPLLKEKNSRILRPANYPAECPGSGAHLFKTARGHKVLILNLQGRTFMSDSVDDPFRAADALIKKYSKQKPDVVFVDFHAEATAEKCTLMHYLDGRVAVLVGTHTHIPTHDARVTKHGTAYVTDVGAVFAQDSSIGVEYEAPLYRALMQMPKAFSVETEGPFCLNAVVVTIDMKQKLSKNQYGPGLGHAASAIKHIVKVVS